MHYNTDRMVFCHLCRRTTLLFLLVVYATSVLPGQSLPERGVPEPDAAADTSGVVAGQEGGSAFGLPMATEAEAADLLPFPGVDVMMLASMVRSLPPDAPATERARILLRASVLFSGAGPDRQAAAIEAGMAMVDAATATAGTPPYERGKALLDLVYGTISTYREQESRIDYALLDGLYNCVSSSTLYAVTALAAGLEVHGVATLDHAYVVLMIGGKPVVVETTNALGYDAKTRTIRTASGPDGRLVPVIPARDTLLDDMELVSLVLRNRATLDERARRWDSALTLAVDMYGWIPDSALAREHLSGRINNLVANDMNSGRYERAWKRADLAAVRYAEVPELAELRRTAGAALLTEFLRGQSSPEEAMSLVRFAGQSGLVDAAWLERAWAYAYARRVEKLHLAGDHLGAWTTATEGLAQYPKNRDLVQLAGTARTNWVYAEHNRFADLYNQGRYGDALSVVLDALRMLPAERLLLDDEKLARKAMPSD